MNAYVASNLSDLGRIMQADRENQTKSALGRMEQQRLQQQALMQQLYQQRAQEQQQSQFLQELAMRRDAQQQQAQYQQGMLGLRQKELDFSQNGITPAMQWDDNYRNAALLNQLEVAKINAGRNDPTVAAMRVRQEAETARDAALALENWEAEKSAAETKAAEYNALLNSIKGRTPGKIDELDNLTTWRSTAENKAKEWENEEMRKLIEALRADTRPGQISPTPDGKFQPVVRPRPSMPQSMGSPNGFNPTARFDTEVNAGQGIPAPAGAYQLPPALQQQQLPPPGQPTNAPVAAQGIPYEAAAQAAMIAQKLMQDNPALTREQAIAQAIAQLKLDQYRRPQTPNYFRDLRSRPLLNQLYQGNTSPLPTTPYPQ